jgi:predicted nucleic acid-binding protein
LNFAGPRCSIPEFNEVLRNGIHVHDARIVAPMTVHQVRTILTFDLDDFKRYGHITVLNAKAV